MTGKEKCEFLKEIRRRMAVANGIPYKPRECNHEGDCLGTCPLCEIESQYILEELKKKESEGKEIQADSFAIEELDFISSNCEAMEEEDNKRHLQNFMMTYLGDLFLLIFGFIKSQNQDPNQSRI